jgi:choline dehydrogenase-like flavoprotein
MDESRDILEAEYVVVGSGAGGGTVAARLAEAGHTVLLLEAGGDPKTAGPETTAEYDVPAFHPFATENADMRWDFFVRHYASDAQQARDPKYRQTWNGQPTDGVFYPRVGALGGCTSHNALIFVYPHDSDWIELADLTGDPSWRPEAMRGYFERLENCGHRTVDRALAKFGVNPSRHGWDGWLSTERAAPSIALRNRDLRSVLMDTARAALQDDAKKSGTALGALSDQEGDPNDYRIIRDDSIGVRYTPMTTRNHARVGTRERLLDVAKAFPDRLRIVSHALATRVLFDDSNRATGVEFLEGERLYRAHPQASDAPGVLRQAAASREVIVSGGAFNTPQLLMLSGVGDRDQLAAHGIATRVHLPGVGRNLQDRYEVAVVNRMAFDSWDVLRGATFTRADPQYREWNEHRTGVYATNGSLLSVVLRSGVDRPFPDLFCYALLAKFPGYYPGYSEEVRNGPNYLTWVVLKGHTNNTAGSVSLRSADPRDTPVVNFHYFEESNDAAGSDLHAVIEGVKFVRRLTAGMKQEGVIAEEEMPGAAVATDDQLKEFVRDHAWGHHASCSCPIGKPENNGVLDSNFTVHGTQGLRVVDASVFPRVPGLFIVSAVYMIGEKAADVIAADAKRNAPARRAAQVRT